MNKITPLILAGFLCTQVTQGAVSVYNGTSKEIAVHSAHSATDGTTSTNQIEDATLKPSQGHNFGDAIQFGATHTLSLQIDGANVISGNVTAGAQTMTNGPVGLSVSIPSLGNSSSWVGSPTLTVAWTNIGGFDIQVNSVSYPPATTAATGVESKSCGGLCGTDMPIVESTRQGHPMAAYRFQSLVTGLSVYDTPIAYSPPVGPGITFQVTYNQKEAYDYTNCSNFGPKWNLSSISFIQDNTTQLNGDVQCFAQGGGYETFTGINTNTGAFGTGMYSQSRLTRTSPTSYKRTFTDGSSAIYDYADAGTSTRRVFLTRTLDASSNQVSYVYQTATNGIKLTQVIDAIGQTNTLAYGNTNDTLKITSITDPFGRSSSFTFTQTNGSLRLSTITDPVQIVSRFQYGTGDFLNALTTPYGTTSFTYAEASGTKMLTATDPYGATECLQYRDQATIATESAYPAGVLIDTSRIGERNSYYWNKRAWSMGSNDITQASITHWASQNGQVIDIPLYVKQPLEGSVWLNYPGQTNGWGDGITTAQPSSIARVLDDGTTQSTSLAYDGWGNLTNAVDALGRTASYIYSTNGIDLLSVQQKVASSSETLATFSYNTQHLPTFAVVSGITNRLGYSASGQLLKVTNAITQVTTYNYNVKGYLTNIVGYTTADTLSIAYDAAGRVYSLTDAQGYSITNTYDSIDRITNSALPDGTTVQTVYDKLNVSKVRGRDNRLTFYTSDANGRLSTIQDPAGRLFHYDWCGCGALDAITDPKGQMTAWVHDAQSRPTQKLYDDMSKETTGYEAKTSRVKQTTDVAGKSVTIAYNKDNTVQQMAYSGGPATPGVSFTYDSNYNRPTQMVDGIGTYALTYVAAGQPGAGGIQTLDGPLPNDTITLHWLPITDKSRA